MTCPICKRESDPAYRPFYSKRCADLDLSNWLTGAYAVPAAEEDEPDEADAPPGAEER